MKSVLIVGALIFTLFITGCAGSGFDKQATLMPDSVGISLGQARYREEDSAYRSFGVNVTWNLK
jgi:hypothetical protein